MLIRSWLAYQGTNIRGTLANRVSLLKKGKLKVDLLAPYRMKYVAVATHLDDGFSRFAADCPRAIDPDAAMTRVLRFAADRSPLFGEVQVPRERFGAVVLRTDWADVSRRDGEAIADAMLAHRFLVEATPDALEKRRDAVLALAKYHVVKDASGYVTGYASDDVTEGASDVPVKYVIPSSSSSSYPPPGSPAPGANGRRNGHATLSAADRAVLVALDRKEGEASAHSSPLWNRLRAAKKAVADGHAESAEVIALIDEATARWPAVAQEVRRTFAMAANQRG